MKIFIEKPYLLALLISATLALWLLSGQTSDTNDFSSKQEVEQKSSTQTAQSPLIKVRVRKQRAKPLTREIILTGRTAPLRTATLKAEVQARVVEIGAQRGDLVQPGEMIVRLAIDDREFHLQEAQALVQQREFEYKAKKNLSRKGYQSQVQIAEALTLLKNAQSQVKQAQLALENLVIRAPFEGILVKRVVEEGDYVNMSDPIAEIMDQDPFLIIGDVTELQRHHLTKGHSATARLVTGETVTGHIHLIAHRADEATRTFQVEIKIPNLDGKIVAGMTAEIRIPLESVLAHQVSAALLSLNDEGILGVKTVGSDNRVHFYPANFARSGSQGIWLTDLPPLLRFITVGQGFVRSGDLVQPVLEN
jgi:multidrug efflux system membrane fusion protein